jgi:hypothetical protein
MGSTSLEVAAAWIFQAMLDPNSDIRILFGKENADYAIMATVAVISQEEWLRDEGL